MNVTDGAAEEIVKIGLDGLEVVARITGSAAKNIAAMLLALAAQSKRMKGRTVLSALKRQGANISVFNIPQKDLKTFVRNAKKYCILYSVIRSKTDKNDNAPVSIAINAADAPRAQRLIENCGIGSVEQASVKVDDVIESRNEKQKETPQKTAGQMAVDAAMEEPLKKEGNEQQNPLAVKTDAGSPSERSSEASISEMSIPEEPMISIDMNDGRAETGSSGNVPAAEAPAIDAADSVPQKDMPTAPIETEHEFIERIGKVKLERNGNKSKPEKEAAEPKPSVIKKLEAYKEQIEHGKRSERESSRDEINGSPKSAVKHSKAKTNAKSKER